MKLSLVLALTAVLRAAIAQAYSTYNPPIDSIYTDHSEFDRSSERQLRATSLNYGEIFKSVVGASPTTATYQGKCRIRETGEVIIIGQKTSKSAKSKRSSKAPGGTRAPGSTRAPAPAPSPNTSSKAPKSARPDKLTVDDLTVSTKASKSGRYEGADVPFCDQVTTTTTLGDQTCQDIKNGVLTIPNVVDQFHLYVTVGGEKIQNLLADGLADELRTQIRLALARLSGCTEGQLARRHLLRRLNGNSYFAANDIQSLDNGQSVLSACDQFGSTCLQFFSEVDVGGSKNKDVYQALKNQEPEVLAGLQERFGPDVRFVIISVGEVPTQDDSGSGGGGGGGVAGVQDPEERSVQKDDKALSAGGFIGIAGAFLILLLLLLLCCVKRRRNQDKSYMLTDDEQSNAVDENYFDNDSSVSDLPPGRLAHVVGEENSQYTGTSWGNKSRIRVDPIENVPEDETMLSYTPEISPEGLPNQQLHDDLQAGPKTKFVSNNSSYDTSVGGERDYMASDTVDL